MNCTAEETVYKLLEDSAHIGFSPLSLGISQCNNFLYDGTMERWDDIKAILCVFDIVIQTLVLQGGIKIN